MNCLQIEGYRKYLSRPFTGKQFLVYSVQLPCYDFEDDTRARVISSPCLRGYIEYLKGKTLKITLPSGVLARCRVDGGPLDSYEEPWGKCIVTYFEFTDFHDNTNEPAFAL